MQGVPGRPFTTGCSLLHLDRTDAALAVVPEAYGMARATLAMAASTQASISNRMPSTPSLRMNRDMANLSGVACNKPARPGFHCLEHGGTIA